MVNAADILNKVEEIEKVLKGIRSDVASLLLESTAPASSAKPSTQTQTNALPDPLKLKWRQGKYGEYAFRLNQDKTPNPDAAALIEAIATAGGKLTVGGYTYTSKGDFLNRR